MTNFKQIFRTKLILTLFSFMLIGVLIADEINYSDSWGKQGFELTQQKTSGVEVVYSIHSFTFSSNQINGKSMDVIELPGNLLPNNEGAPNLPGTGHYIAIPQGANVTFEVTASRTETFKNIDLAPAPRIPWETESGPLEYNRDMSIYSKDEFYPVNPVSTEITQIRGVDVVMLGVTPFQYNPVTKELIVYHDLKIEVNFEGGNGQFGDNRLRSRWWDPLLSDMLLNYESLPKMDYNKSFQATEDIGCEYLIITPDGDEFQQWADSIKKFRTMQGILTDIKTISDVGGNNSNTIENYINNAYNTWDIVPAACLLLGDYGTSGNTIHSPTWDNYCVSDNIYADVTNNDMPDIVFARMTAQNATHLETMVTKFLDHERTPPTNPGYYQNPITALGFQTERWFQICSESVAGFWEVVQGKTANRINAIYSGNPQTAAWSTATNTTTVVNVFGPNGLGYIPATPGQVNCTWYGSGSDVVNGINNGAFMLQHRDHGGTTGWGEPAFSNSNINSLNNTDLTFVWSINCLTGKYDIPGECFAEKFHRHTSGGNNSGALGINAASEVSYSFVNDTYVWGAYDNMWPEFLPDYGTTPDSRGVLPAFGNAAGKYFLQQSSWPYNPQHKVYTHHLFHHHGDAFMTVYSELPQDLTVTHNPILYAGVTSFDVTANDGAFIALTVNGEIIGTAEATGGPVSITIPAQQPPHQMIVTITKQNYYRYESVVEIIPPSGPYVVHNAVEINDEAGNGNGIMETDESILASLTVENVGVEEAENVTVTITTADEYVDITDNTENYGNIAAGATAVVEDGFAWDVADNIPDMHMVIFELNATDGNDTWTTFFSVEGHGPELEIGSMSIDDSQGNGNGRLDPGETVDIYFETFNTGSFHAIGAIGTLNTTSGYLTLNNSSHDFNVLGSGLMEEAVFNVTVSGNAPIGTAVSFIYDVTSGGYNVQETFATSIGLIVEDWETGDMGQYDWTTGGNANWTVSTQNPYEGTYCVKSGNIGDQQSTWLQLEYEVFSDDVISFWYKVSSEGTFDFLKFYIDNNEQGSWSGEVGWAEAEFPVSAGVHTFKWEFEKDYSVSTGGDCGWVDFIILPAPPMTTAYAGPDGDICEGDDYQCEGTATLYNAVHWQTSGTGSFDNSQQLNALYTPSTDDISNGSVTLSLTAYGPDNTVTDEMLLTISGAPIAIAGDDDVFCSDASYELINASAENYISVEWTTSGDGTFDDNNIINPVYTPGTADIEAGTVTLMFAVTGSEACGDANDDIMLTIETAATAYAGGNTEVCSNLSLTLSEALAENYSSIEWATSGDGTFDDVSLMNPEYTPGTNDAINGTVTLTLSAMGNGSCGEITSEVMLTVLAGPQAFAGDDNWIAYDETYTLSDAIAENYTSIAWSTSGDGTFDDASAVNPTYTSGTIDIENEEAVLTMTASNDECGDISDEMGLAISPLGVYENLADFNISIFPNPSNGSFTLELNGKSDELVNIRIYNSLGNIVFESNNISINKTYTEKLNLNVDQGIYYLKIEGEELLVNRKIIIKK